VKSLGTKEARDSNDIYRYININLNITQAVSPLPIFSDLKHKRMHPHNVNQCNLRPLHTTKAQTQPAKLESPLSQNTQKGKAGKGKGTANGTERDEAIHRQSIRPPGSKRAEPPLPAPPPRPKRWRTSSSQRRSAKRLTMLAHQ
jgi:hypothetical protein